MIFILLLPLLALVNAAPTPTSCFMCIGAIEFTLENPNLGNETEEILDIFCAALPGSVQKECKKLAAKLDAILTMLTKNMAREMDSPQQVCAMIDECSNKCCLSPNTPEQVHISYIGDPHTQMGIVWTTLNNVSSVVQYGTSPSRLTSALHGSVGTFTEGGWIGFMHYARLNNLVAGTTYYYRVGDGQNAWSKTFSFKTEPLNTNRVIRIVEIGDMGNVNSAPNIKRIQSMVDSNSVDFIVHSGDISYADGDQTKWDSYMRTMEPITANVPYMVCPGNHEIGVIGALGVALGYVNRFIMPGNASTDLQNLYYSFNYGPIHFVSLDTESIYDLALLTDQQSAWLAQDLATVDRKKTPWVIVFGHRPFYCSNKGDDCDIEADVLKKAAQEIFVKNKVDLVFMAHKHNYERFWPTKLNGDPVKSYENPDAPVYILNGAGGNREGVEHHSSPLPNSVSFISEWGYGLLTVYNSSTLEWGFYGSADGALLDSFVLKVDH